MPKNVIVWNNKRQKRKDVKFETEVSKFNALLVNNPNLKNSLNIFSGHEYLKKEVNDPPELENINKTDEGNVQEVEQSEDSEKPVKVKAKAKKS